ncbi:hypothetical protein EJ05DRAFT_487435 [Pseudovirgaria hyperparasitica]|uniref:BZIP domain-containing protein n=1 Tax=Pseudovirgaria hyperparasitica TaxID=470096 RepID=A0A6A6W0V9_9PEZI|nr:uncharacterized protein EJ05DRAFT_487435 [Pseudovirgaria hyperparasitica]KAF2756548.1 hypothetical protein EJ05DRAFT_487435 [Pseudovirgaria hyperparasitica]
MTAPREKQVPSPGDPDRKRVLNVLAQRRYRQRRREKIKALEDQARGQREHNVTRDSSSLSPSDQSISSSSHSPYAPSHSGSSDNGVIANQDAQLFTPYNNNDDLFLNQQTLQHSIQHNNILIDSLMPLPDDAWIEDAETLPLDPTSQDLTTLGFPDLTTKDLETLPDDPFTSTFLFPMGNDRNIDVPLLAALNASFKLACMLGCTDNLWDPFASRTLSSDSLPIFAHLPASMQPTKAQQTIPHHPVLDMLPWPEVRTKIICCFSLPEFMRPPVARGEMPQVTLIQHIDDESDPVRIVGNEADDKGWEIGQTFYQNWWWAFDRATVENTNRLRAERGAPKLRLLPASQAASF